jgi:tetratricopeptide (TPR) repeat protein
MLAKVEALCGLQRYIEALSLIEKELLEANEANEFDVLKWKCEISLHLNKYDEVKKCLTIMEKIDPGNLIISVFRSRLTSAN